MNDITDIGIDPGLKGAIAAIWPDGHAEVWKTPLVPIVVNKKKKMVLDPWEIRRIIMDIQSRSEKCFATVEKVGPMRRSGKKGQKGQAQGVTSAFSFGKGTGIEIGVLVGLGVKYDEPAPQTWKKEIFKDMGKDKRDKAGAIALCLKWYPELRDSVTGIWQKRVVYYDGPAEATLIARFGRMIGKGAL